MNGVTGEGHDDGNGPGGLLDGPDGRAGLGDDDVNLEANELRRQLLKPLGAAVRVARFEQDALPFDVPERAEALAKRLALEMPSAADEGERYPIRATSLRAVPCQGSAARTRSASERRERLVVSRLKRSPPLGSFEPGAAVQAFQGGARRARPAH